MALCLGGGAGYVIAQYNLANCYVTGAAGIWKTDVIMAISLYLRSASQGMSIIYSFLFFELSRFSDSFISDMQMLQTTHSGDVSAFNNMVKVLRGNALLHPRMMEFGVPSLLHLCLASCRKLLKSFNKTVDRCCCCPQREEVALPEEILHQLKNEVVRCVRPECEVEFYGRGRVVWRYVLKKKKKKKLDSSCELLSSQSEVFRHRAINTLHCFEEEDEDSILVPFCSIACSDICELV